MKPNQDAAGGRKRNHDRVSFFSWFSESVDAGSHSGDCAGDSHLCDLPDLVIWVIFLEMDDFTAV